MFLAPGPVKSKRDGEHAGGKEENGDAQAQQPTEEASKPKAPYIPFHIATIKLPHKGEPETVVTEYFGEGYIPDWLLSQDTLVHTSYYWEGVHDYIWLPVKFIEGEQDLRTFYTCVNRMDYLEQLLVTHPQVPKRVRCAVRELQDRYQILTLHMESKKIYRDSQISARVPRNNENNGEFETISPLDLFAPAKGMEFSVSDLPDLTVPFVYLKYWGNKTEHIFEDPVIIKLIELFSKHLPYPSKRRSVAQTIIKCWSEMRDQNGNVQKAQAGGGGDARDKGYFDSIFSIIMRILFASLLGVYEHCEVVSNFAVRRKLYRWFCISRPDEKEFSDWLGRYSYVIIYAMREYMFFIIEKISAFDQLFSATTYWKFLKRNAYGGTDMMRRVLNESVTRYSESYDVQEGMWECIEQYGLYFENYIGVNGDSEPALSNASSTPETGDDFVWLPKRSWFSGINDSLKQLNKQSLTRANRPIAECFENTVLSKMTKIETEKAKNKNLNYQSVADAGVVPPEILQRIDDIVDRFDPFDSIHFKWLGDYPVNMGHQLIRYLSNGKYLYEMETTVSVLKNCIEYMYVYFPYDYQVFKKFCQAVKTKRSVKCYDLPSSLFARQCKAWVRVFQTLPGEAVDDSAGLYYMCQNCGNLKISVRHYNPGNDPNSLGEWTSEGVCIDLTSGKFYCTKASSKNNPKKRNPTVNVIKETLNLDKGDDEGLKQSVSESVVETVGEYLDSDDEEEGEDGDAEDSGNGTSLNPPKKKRARKNKQQPAAAPAEVQVKTKQDKFKKKMDMLRKCLQTELIPTNLTGRLIRNEKGLIMLCPHCVHPMYYSHKIFSKGTSKISCGCQDDGRVCKLECAVCGRDCSEKYHVHLVYDDTDNRCKAEFMPFCDKHRHAWIRRVGRLPRLSELKRLQKTRLYIKMMENGDFILLDCPDNRKRYRSTRSA